MYRELAITITTLKFDSSIGSGTSISLRNRRQFPRVQACAASAHPGPPLMISLFRAALAAPYLFAREIGQGVLCKVRLLYDLHYAFTNSILSTSNLHIYIVFTNPGMPQDPISRARDRSLSPPPLCNVAGTNITLTPSRMPRDPISKAGHRSHGLYRSPYPLPTDKHLRKPQDPISRAGHRYHDAYHLPTPPAVSHPRKPRHNRLRAGDVATTPIPLPHGTVSTDRHRCHTTHHLPHHSRPFDCPKTSKPGK